jgi:hypothetical protein
VVEFAVNDHDIDRRPYEQLLRSLLRLPSNPTVLMLQLYPWWRSASDGVLEGLYNREPEVDKTVLAQVSCGLYHVLGRPLDGWGCASPAAQALQATTPPGCYAGCFVAPNGR